MTSFINRERKLSELNQFVAESQPQFVVGYSRHIVTWSDLL